MVVTDVRDDSEEWLQKKYDLTSWCRRSVIDICDIDQDN